MRKPGSYLCCVFGSESEVIAEDEAERSSVNGNRVCGLTASNYPSACCLLGNRTYSFIPEKMHRASFLVSEKKKPSYEQK